MPALSLNEIGILATWFPALASRGIPTPGTEFWSPSGVYSLRAGLTDCRLRGLWRTAETMKYEAK